MKPSEWIDITCPLEPGIPQWLGDPVLETRLVSEAPRVTTLSLCAHTGTHVDAPCHYLPGGASVEAMPLEALIGPAIVTAETNPPAAERVLFKTKNSETEWWRQPYREGMAELTLDTARQLVRNKTRLVGIDYLSIGSEQVHRTLLEAGIVVVEGLCLNSIEPGDYDLICLPLKLIGSDGAPARVVLRQAGSPSR